jgi:ABC-type amino acid transport substrate-binding protein
MQRWIDRRGKLMRSQSALCHRQAAKTPRRPFVTTFEVDPGVRAELAPTGILRAGINTGNFLLVTDRAENGDPMGVSPDVAAEIARRLGVAH